MIFIYSIKEKFGYRKIGITNNPKGRLKAIKSTYRRARWSVILPTPFIARIIEKAFHRALNWCRVNRKGSGKTEWFYMPFLAMVVDLVLTAVVALSWWGVWEAFKYLTTLMA